MRAEFSNLNELWGAIAVEELIRSGVETFCVSSGSRSTPLAYAISQNKKAKAVVHFDERGSAFYALGHARATGKPAALICTSGTAVANYFPAVVEASVDHIPMIILSADRPPELRQTGANQTIDQVKIFGDYVRWQMDIPCPDEKIPPEFLLTTIDQAVSRATGTNPGPVHLNIMFREPLAPEKKSQNFKSYLSNVSEWLKINSAFTVYPESHLNVSGETVKKVAGVITKSKTGMIVAGKMSHAQSAAVLKLSRKIGWPVLPDIGSGLRLGAKDDNVITYFDQMLHSDKFLKLNPDTVIHFGTQLVSKRLLQFLEKARPTNYIRIANNPKRLDPNHQVASRVNCDITDFCEKLNDSIKSKNKNDLTDKFSTMSAQIDRVLEDMLDKSQSGRASLSEPAVCRVISRNISKQSALFLASSLPVREMDMFAAGDGNPVPVEYNRGGSGIDGTIASAVGYAGGLNRPVTLLIGDLAFLHDLSSLALVKNSKVPVTMVVLNNDGGGIFSFLPVANIGAGFEKFFGTPHGLNFQKSAEQFEIKYSAPRSIDEFTKTYLNSQRNRVSSIVEIKTNRDSNFELHQKISQSIKKALDKN